MKKEEILQEIIRLASNSPAENLSEGTFSLTDEATYLAAVEFFGGWDLALVHALQSVISKPISKPRRVLEVSEPICEFKPFVPSEQYSGLPTRQPHPEAMRPICVLTVRGYLLTMEASALPSSPIPGAPQALDDWWDIFGLPTALADLEEVDAVIAFSEDGQALGWDRRVIPPVSNGDAARRLGAKNAVQAWVTATDRALMRPPRVVVSVSEQGKVKLTKVSAYPGTVTADGLLAFLVDNDDRAIAVHIAEPKDHLFLVSSDGFAIHFPLNEVRPMGLKASGVRGMTLKGGARIVGSLITDQVDEVALITRAGVGKRVSLEEFRPQSRAGLGLIATKLQAEDSLAAVCASSLESDLVVLTNKGRALRLPAEAFPLTGRPTRGNSLLDLAQGEAVSGLHPLLPMEFGTQPERAS